MTFLGGGRSCVGFKFSQLEMSTGVHFTFSIYHLTCHASQKSCCQCYSRLSDSHGQGTFIGTSLRSRTLPLDPTLRYQGCLSEWSRYSMAVSIVVI